MFGGVERDWKICSRDLELERMVPSDHKFRFSTYGMARETEHRAQERGRKLLSQDDLLYCNAPAFYLNKYFK